jgi:hypothetical protein
MNAAYTNAAETETASTPFPLFYHSDRRYQRLKERVTSDELKGMRHDELERVLEPDGRELLRCLLQDHFNLRGQARGPEAVEGADGIVRTHHREGSCVVGTIFGGVRLERESIGARGTNSLHPVDADLNLPPGKHSLEVQRRVAELTQRGSFESATELLRAATGTTAGKLQVEELTVEAAKDVEAFYDETRLDVKSEDTGPLGVMSFDSAGIVMRTEDLREQTRRAAEEKTPKLRTRLTKGEKPNRKRMAAVRAVYTVEPFARTPEQVVAGLDGSDEGEAKRPKPENKQVSASVLQAMPAVVDQAFQEAKKRDPRREKKWAALVDGDPKQRRAIQSASRHHKLKVLIILDIIHVIEYLWRAAHVLCGESTPEAESWVTDRLLRILRGEAGQVAGGIARAATRKGLSATARKQLRRSARYLKRHRRYMRYDEYLAAGFPIATGVIEGACRYLVRDRMDITGARWGLRGAEAVLKLRAVFASGDFQAYWAFHCEAEYRRNHGSAYAGGHHPELKYPRRYAHLTVVK